MRWMNLEPIIQSEVSQKDKDHYSILTHIYGILKDGNDNPICKTEKETQMYRTVFWTLWEKARVVCFKRTASKHVYYLGWNRSAAEVGCMRQTLGPGALGRPRGIRSRGRWERGLGWGTHVNPWLIHFNVWQNPLQWKKESCINNFGVIYWSKMLILWNLSEGYVGILWNLFFWLLYVCNYVKIKS